MIDRGSWPKLRNKSSSKPSRLKVRRSMQNWHRWWQRNKNENYTTCTKLSTNWAKNTRLRKSRRKNKLQNKMENITKRQVKAEIIILRKMQMKAKLNIEISRRLWRDMQKDPSIWKYPIIFGKRERQERAVDQTKMMRAAFFSETVAQQLTDIISNHL